MRPTPIGSDLLATLGLRSAPPYYAALAPAVPCSLGGAAQFSPLVAQKQTWEPKVKLPIHENARSALIIVDMQKYFFQDVERRRNLDQVVNNINTLIDYFDECSLPVFHVVSCYQANRSDWDLKMKTTGEPELIIGTQEAEILSEIRVSKRHNSIIKTRYSAFFKTNLAELLQDHRIDRVVVIGAYTHYCVNATIFDAYCYDFVPSIITDAVISHLEKEANVMIDRMRRNGYHVFTTQELIAGMACCN